MNKAFERCFVVSIVYTLRSVPYKSPEYEQIYSNLLIAAIT